MISIILTKPITLDKTIEILNKNNLKNEKNVIRKDIIKFMNKLSKMKKEKEKLNQKKNKKQK